MTATHTHNGTTVPPTFVTGELLDALIEAVVLPPNPRIRSTVINALVEEMCAAVEWLHDHDTALMPEDAFERSSIRQLAAAAHDHRMRMCFLGTGAPESGDHR